jgi:hypothetical protein
MQRVTAGAMQRCRTSHSCIASSRLARNAGRAMARSSTTPAAMKAAEIGRMINTIGSPNAAQVFFYHWPENVSEHYRRGLAVELEQHVADPTFTWVRLAQRIPVRIHITHVPPGVLISAGMTCTVVIKEGAAPEIGRGLKKVMTAIFGTPSS